MNTTFVYVTYIRTTQDKLWDPLTRPEFTRVYFKSFLETGKANEVTPK